MDADEEALLKEQLQLGFIYLTYQKKPISTEIREKHTSNIGQAPDIKLYQGDD